MEKKNSFKKEGKLGTAGRRLALFSLGILGLVKSAEAQYAVPVVYHPISADKLKEGGGPIINPTTREVTNPDGHKNLEDYEKTRQSCEEKRAFLDEYYNSDFFFRRIMEQERAFQEVQRTGGGLEALLNFKTDQPFTKQDSTFATNEIKRRKWLLGVGWVVFDRGGQVDEDLPNEVTVFDPAKDIDPNNAIRVGKIVVDGMVVVKSPILSEYENNTISGFAIQSFGPSGSIPPSARYAFEQINKLIPDDSEEGVFITIGQIYALRFMLKKKGIYDPITQVFTEDMALKALSDPEILQDLFAGGFMGIFSQDEGLSKFVGAMNFAQ